MTDPSPVTHCATCTHPRGEHDGGVGRCLVGSSDPVAVVVPPTRPLGEAPREGMGAERAGAPASGPTATTPLPDARIPECGCERFMLEADLAYGSPSPLTARAACPLCRHEVSGMVYEGQFLPAQGTAHAPDCAHYERKLHTDRQPPPAVHALACVCGHELACHAGGEACRMMLQEGPRAGETCACRRFQSSSQASALAAAFARYTSPEQPDEAPTNAATPKAREDERLWASYFAAFLSQGKSTGEAEELAETAFAVHQRRWGGR